AGIVLAQRRIRGAVTFGPELHAFRADRAVIEVDRGRSRSAVQRKGHRATRARNRVRNEHHVRDGLALLIEHRQGADSSLVVEGPAAQLDALVYRLVLRKRLQFVLFVLGRMLLILRWPLPVLLRGGSVTLLFGR